MVIESNFYYFKRMKKIDYYNQFADEFALATLYVDMESVRRQLSWPVRVNYDGRLGFLIFPTSSLF